MLSGFLLILFAAAAGGMDEPVRFTGETQIEMDVHDGGLRPPVGVANYQVLRANRTRPELAEDCGWTYNHAPMMAYWNDRYWVEYLSNPVDEHIAPGQTLVATSADGCTWSKPQVVFPPYVPPPGTEMPTGSNGYMMHQRMGFYVSRDGRLLVLAFYGHAEDPFREGGIGRVVREAYKDGTFGPIYFIRYCSHTKWNETNTAYPFYKTSPDAGFVAACDALLNDKLKTLQWYDEDRGLDGFYSIKPHRGQAFNCYRRNDGQLVGLWKRSMAALSNDNGATWSDPVKCPTLVMAGGKQWGQRTEDGRYAILYNPTKMDEYRYPLIAITGDDGVTFDEMLVVHGEVPPRRFFGRWKDFGPCYVRGITEGNGDPPGNNLWVTYSVNKEDIWVSKVPAPFRCRVDAPVNDEFDDMVAGGHVRDWNVYSPVWAPVSVAAFPTAENRSLQLRDTDPCDYAKAVRIFKESTAPRIRFRLCPRQTSGLLDVELNDSHGRRPVRIRFDTDGHVKVANGKRTIDAGAYPAGWLEVEIAVDASDRVFDLAVTGIPPVKKARFAERVRSVERICFRTGDYRVEPTRKTANQKACDPLPGADEPAQEAVFYIDDLTAE